MSKFFIDRPNFAWVVAIMISLAGLLAMPSLPVAQFPSLAPPQISIVAGNRLSIRRSSRRSSG